MKKTVIFLFLFFSINVCAETFFPLPELSESCAIEVGSYEIKVKNDVQGYVSGIELDLVKTLMQLRRDAIKEGFISIQKKIDSNLYTRLTRIASRPSVVKRNLNLMTFIKDELATYPLEISKLENDTLIEKFNSSGI